MRATTADQKAEALARLLEAWKRHPKQRLGQFLENVSSELGQAELFYVEDYDLVRAAEEY